MCTELLVHLRHLLEDPHGRLALGRESEVSSELAALGDELLLGVNLDLVQFLLQLLLCRGEEHRIACCGRMSYILSRISQKRTCLGRPHVSIGDAPPRSSCAKVSKDAKNLHEVHVDEQDSIDRLDRRTRVLRPPLPDEL